MYSSGVFRSTDLKTHWFWTSLIRNGDGKNGTTSNQCIFCTCLQLKESVDFQMLRVCERWRSWAVLVYQLSHFSGVD